MEIVVLSGKGGTGKTTVATNLAHIMNMAYIDCDVEEPNGHIFLKPSIEEQRDATILNPVIDEEFCIRCGKCASMCQFNALAVVRTGVMLFNELCHGCGACKLVCSKNAITEQGRPIGCITIGKTENIQFVEGRLNVGEPMGGPIISEVKAITSLLEHRILDASPGTSCNVVKTLEGADYAVLVTEPTKFGLHDLKLAVELVEMMDIPFGIVINRHYEGELMIQNYCESEDIDIIGEIPFSREAAELYSRGALLIEDKRYRRYFEELSTKLLGKVRGRC